MRVGDGGSPDVLWRVVQGRACYGVLVRDGVVVRTAPIGKWMRGRDWRTCAIVVLQRGGTATRV